MSIPYLESLIPIPKTENQQPNDVSSLFQDFSLHDISILSAQFGKFMDDLGPFKDKIRAIEGYLFEFDSEITKLCESLYSLQSRSMELSTGLNKHQSLVDTLNPVILDLIIPPSISSSILADPIDEKWTENIIFINEKTQLVESLESNTSGLEYKDYIAFGELKSGLKHIKAKATERIRNHIIEQIRHLRRSLSTSSQAVQVKLLKIKDIFLFLKEQNPKLANQLQLAYIYTMKWYYTTRFAKYLYSLQKLRLKAIDSSYVLGSSGDSHEGARLGIFEMVGAGYASAQSPTGLNTSSGTSTPSKVTITEYFQSVTQRLSILAEDGDASRAMPSQIAESTPFSYWIEFVFNQFSNAVVDNIVVEYLFVVEFFYQGTEKFDAISTLDLKLSSTDDKKDWAHLMFEDIYKMGHAYANWLITTSHQSIGSRIVSGNSSASSSYASSNTISGTCDCYGVILMIGIVQKQTSILHNRFHVPVLDEYHNSLLLLLWPHFTKIIDLNCEALKKNVLGKTSYAHGSSVIGQTPIQTTQQVAQLISGLLKLALADESEDENQLSFSKEPIYTSVHRLRNDFESALTKASAYMFGTNKSKAVQKEMFLFNNYFLVVTILSNEFDSSSNPFINEQIKHFQLLCDAYRPK